MSVLETIDSNLLANLLTDIETNDTNPNQNVQKENLTLVPVTNDEPNDDELVDFLKIFENSQTKNSTTVQNINSNAQQISDILPKMYFNNSTITINYNFNK